MSFSNMRAYNRVTKKYEPVDFQDFGNGGGGGVIPFTQIIGDGISTTFLVVHSLGLGPIHVDLYDRDLKQMITGSVVWVDEDTISVEIVPPPRTDGVQVTVKMN